jgi:subtilisin family serine protease
MRRLMLMLFLLVASGSPAFAQQRVIVRDELGLSGLKGTCLILNCNVNASLGDPSGRLFLITVNGPGNLNSFLSSLLRQVGVVGAELDQQLLLIQASAGPIPESLLDETPLVYYGTTVWDGYANQPAAQIVRVLPAQSAFHVSGAGTVAMIDTGVDTQHPALVVVLVPGYNFVNNTSNADEKADVNQSSAAVLDGGSAEPTYVNSSTIAVLNQSSAAVLDGGQYNSFGHGTMTAGIVHLVAPTAKIMPLKAFSADGSGYVSNIIQAVYYASQHHVQVISMSFSFSPSSSEMAKAIQYANAQGIICVASAGNDGEDELVYPAALSGVMGVASTTDYDTRSNFSNYGSDVWVAAPGEGIISTYPYGTYSAGWGTSFSAPFVAGTAALLVDASPGANQKSAAAAIANAKWVSSDMGNGRLDAYLAVQSLIEAGTGTH